MLGPGSSADDLLTAIRKAVACGVDWVQIREKDLPARELFRIAREANSIAGPAARIVVNDRLDVALAAGAGGVHLGSESAPVSEVVRWCRAGHAPEGFLVGASCHQIEGAVGAEKDGADYVFFGPVFATPSKLRYGPPQGIEPLAEVCRRVRIPVLAIGGVTAANAAECLRAGAAGIAAIRLFQEATDAEALRAELARLW